MPGFFLIMTPFGDKVGWENMMWDVVTTGTGSTTLPTALPLASTCRTANMSDMVMFRSVKVQNMYNFNDKKMNV